MNEIKILIVGANFDNKGAQSMLFVTVDEIKKRIPNAHIYFGSPNKVDKNYLFDTIYYSGREKQITLGKQVLKNIIDSFCRDFIKFILRKNNNFCKYMELKKLLEKTDLIIDISGFSIGNKWPISVQEEYLDNIRLAKKFNIPMILMPQSFGPFDYSDNHSLILSEIKELFAYPLCIYAREEEGYASLINDFNLTNVVLSTDLVLQNTGIDIHNILFNTKKFNLPQVYTKNNVGIVPNYQCFSHGNKKLIMHMYEVTIKKLIKLGYNVYIFRHSKEDITACREIFEQNKNKNVFLIENDFSCFEFDEWVNNFDFIIASRYHSAVHSYKKNIPCILYGWAMKYKELAINVDLESVYVDITKNVDDKQLEVLLESLSNNLIEHKKRIASKIVKIQEKNCFDKLEKFISNKNR